MNFFKYHVTFNAPPRYWGVGKGFNWIMFGPVTIFDTKKVGRWEPTSLAFDYCEADAKATAELYKRMFNAEETKP